MYKSWFEIFTIILDLKTTYYNVKVDFVGKIYSPKKVSSFHMHLP